MASKDQGPGDATIAILMAGAGFCHGAGLALWGVFAAGAGHGAYVVIGVSSAPTGMFQDITLAIIAAPFLWGVVGVLAALSRFAIARAVALVILLSHYASLIFILSPPSAFAEWTDVPGGWFAVWVGLLQYAAGQAVMWWWFLNRSKQQCT